MDVFLFEIDDREILVYRSVYAPVKSNMYTILTEKDAVVIDPNVDEDLLVLFKNKGIERVYILLTHGHYDHISGVEWLKEHTEAKVFCQTKCADRLANNKRSLARLVAFVLSEEDRKDGGHRYQEFQASYKPFVIKADKTFEKKDQLKIGGLGFEVTSTPGHSEGSACYTLNSKLVFTGDTLLQDNPIITKFPGGNKGDYDQIALPYLQSLNKKIIVMPGHGDPFVLNEARYI